MTEEKTLYVNWYSNALHVSTSDTGTSDDTIHEPTGDSTVVTFVPGHGVSKVNQVVVKDSQGNVQTWTSAQSGDNYQVTDPGSAGTYYYSLNANVGTNAKTLDPKWEHD